MHPSVPILIAFALVLMNGFFVATEFALVKVRHTRLAELAKKGNRAAALAEKIVGRLDAYLSAIQLGITLASLGLGWIGEPAFAHLFEPIFHNLPFLREAVAQTVSLVCAFLLITVLHIIFGELAPKWMAIRRTEAVALAVARPIAIFLWIFYPFIWVLNGLANIALKAMRLGPATGEHEAVHSEEELQILLARSHAGGRIPLMRQRLLENVFTFGRRTARQIMIPRADVQVLSVGWPFARIAGQVRASGHTRYPVCETDLDTVLGTLHIKDLPADDPGADGIRHLLRPPLFVPEAMGAERLLLTFQESRQHLAIVVDEYGGASGIVTLEDVLEELVGEVQDEFDEEAPQFLKVKSGGYLVSAGMLLEAVAAQLGVKLEEDIDADTIGGYVQLKLGTLGRLGDTVPFGIWTIKVVEAKGRRLLRLLIEQPGSPAAATPLL